MGQASLDEFMEIKVEKKERIEEKVETVEEARKRAAGSEKPERMNIVADIKDPRHESRCPYCDEWVGKLHAGSIYLYVKNGRLTALADMNHVYEKCRNGLVENLRLLYRMFVDLKRRGLKVMAVGKAYDDDLYAWLKDGGRDLEYDGLRVLVFEARSIEEFERTNRYMNSVDESLLREALRDE